MVCPEIEVYLRYGHCCIGKVVSLTPGFRGSPFWTQTQLELMILVYRIGEMILKLAAMIRWETTPCNL